MLLRSPLRSPLRSTLYRPSVGNWEWSPFDLGASLLAWWDASYGVSIATGVSAWADRKNGYSAAQGTTGAQPAYSATSYNGRPGITFDGTDDELTLASQPFPSGASASEVWVAASQSALVADTGTRMVFSYGGTANATRRAVLRRVVSAANRFGADTGDNASAVATNDTATDYSARNVGRVIFGATTTSVSINGGSATSTSVVPNTGTTRARIGANTANTAGSFWNGIISHIIVTGQLSDFDAALMSEFLSARR